MPGIEIRTDAVIGWIDQLKEVGGDASVARSVTRGSFITVQGWLLERKTLRPARGLGINIGTGQHVEALVGLPRLDVEAAFGKTAAKAGFAAAIPVDAGLGPCTLTLRPHSDGLDHVAEFRNVLDITQAVDPFEHLRASTGDWCFAVDEIETQGKAAARDGTGTYIVDALSPALTKLWAIDRLTKRPARAIIARFGGRHLRLASTVKRADAAAAFEAPQAIDCGFVVPLIPSPVGTTTIELYALDDDDCYAHLTSIRARRTDPFPFSVLPTTAHIKGAIDSIEMPADFMRIQGWAIDVIGPRLCGGIFVTIDGVTVAEGSTEIARPDVAENVGHGGLVRSGFNLTTSLLSLAKGKHEVAVHVCSARRDATALLQARSVNIPARRGLR